MNDVDDRERFPKPAGMTEDEYRAARLANHDICVELVEKAKKQMHIGWQPFVDDDDPEVWMARQYSSASIEDVLAAATKFQDVYKTYMEKNTTQACNDFHAEARKLSLVMDRWERSRP